MGEGPGALQGPHRATSPLLQMNAGIGRQSPANLMLVGDSLGGESCGG